MITSMNNLSDISQIITICGGRAALAQQLEVGVSAVSNYVARGTIPANKRARLADHLLTLGYQLDLASCAIMPLDTGPKDRGAITSHNTSNAPIILLIITGGIAAYKSLELARRLMDEGFVVRGVMTKSAQQFITPLALSALTGQKTYCELFSLTDEQEMGHIRLAREADLVLVAPATGNFIAKITHGLADDLASTLCLASQAPLYIVPAMNPVMWANPATQDNCAILAKRGVIQLGPISGDTACGEVGEGRMLDVPDIISGLKAHRQSHPNKHASMQSSGDVLSSDTSLTNKHILITAGPTREPIDGVRYISNASSGKQGYAIAQACLAQGAKVTLITGPTDLTPPKGATTIQVETARQMYEACFAALPADCAICCAAVADWYVVGASHQKLKKQADSGPPQLEFAENPDILKSLCQSDNRPPLMIGFAAETDHVIPTAIAKRHAKGCDWILANHIAQGDNVFGASDNQLTLIREGEETSWPSESKTQAATRLANEISQYFAEQNAENERAKSS